MPCGTWYGKGWLERAAETRRGREHTNGREGQRCAAYEGRKREMNVNVREREMISSSTGSYPDEVVLVRG